MARPAVDTNRLALAAALTTVVLWASAFVGIRAVATDLSPGSITLGRLAIGTVVLGIALAARGWRRPTLRELGFVVASGLLWFAFYSLALNEAERNVDAGTAAMLVNIGPIFIALFAGLFLGEGFPQRLLAGCAISFVGSIVIGVATSESQAPSGNPTLGVILCVLSAVAYAGGATFQKPALRRLPALEVTWLACLTAAVACLPFAPGLLAEIGRAAPANAAWLIYLGLFPTSIAFTTWAFALGRTSAGRLGSTTYLVPPVVIPMSWLMLGEAPPPLAIAGGALCVGGVMVARATNLPAIMRRPARQAWESDGS